MAENTTETWRIIILGDAGVGKKSFSLQVCNAAYILSAYC